MFSRKKQYLKIQKIHHKALKVVYNGNKIYDEFLWDNNEVSIHQRNLGALICEVLKSLNNLNPEFFKNTTYNIRNGPLLRFKIGFLRHKFSVINCDEWLVFISFNYCTVPT